MNPYQSVSDHLASLVDRTGGTEFGGVGTDPQPYPHDLTPSETLRALYQDRPVETDEQAPSVHGAWED